MDSSVEIFKKSKVSGAAAANFFHFTEHSVIITKSAIPKENKIRIENTTRINGFKINFGANYEFAKYNNSTFNKIFRQSPLTGESSVDTIDFSTQFNMNKYGLFGQISKNLLKKVRDLFL